jgi:hypothetical protein
VARRGTQFQASRPLFARDCGSPFIPRDRRRGLAGAGEGVAVQAMDFRFGPSFAGSSYDPHRFAEGALSQVRLAGS